MKSFLEFFADIEEKRTAFYKESGFISTQPNDEVMSVFFEVCSEVTESVTAVATVDDEESDYSMVSVITKSQCTERNQKYISDAVYDESSSERDEMANNIANNPNYIHE
jgi:hypothetical protein